MLRTYFKALCQSFFSPRLYRDVIYRWKGAGILYLLFLSLIIAVLMSMRLFMSLYSIPQTDVNHVFEQVPVVEITSGELTINEKKPRDITLPNGRIFIRFVDDGDNDFEALKTENKDVTILVTPKEMIVNLPEDQNRLSRQTQTHSFQDMQDMTIDKNFLEKIWYRLKWIFPVIVTPVVALGLWVKYLIQILVISFFSYVITAFMKEEYDFTTRFRICVIAFTPVLLVNQVSQFFLKHEMNFLIVAIMTLMYVYVMIKTTRRII